VFDLEWTEEAESVYLKFEQKAIETKVKREKQHQSKSSKQEGLFNQVKKTLQFLKENPRHPGLHIHPYFSLEHP
jgi:hypothetical protein